MFFLFLSSILCLNNLLDFEFSLFKKKHLCFIRLISYINMLTELFSNNLT